MYAPLRSIFTSLTLTPSTTVCFEFWASAVKPAPNRSIRIYDVFFILHAS